MRRLVWLAVAMFSVEASAKCMGEWFGIAPKKDAVLTTMPRVLVTFGGRNRELKARLEFVAGTERVDTVTEATFEGYMQRLVLVRPAKPLTPGSWELAVTFPRSSNANGWREGPWKVTAAADTEAPRFTGTPALKTTSWEEYGCGPGSSVDVQGVTMSEPVGFVEAAVTVDGVKTVAVLASTADVLGLGHGMCSGNFALKPGAHASVVLTPIDLAGNRGVPAEPIELIAPGPETGKGKQRRE